MRHVLAIPGSTAEIFSRVISRTAEITAGTGTATDRPPETPSTFSLQPVSFHRDQSSVKRFSLATKIHETLISFSDRFTFVDNLGYRRRNLGNFENFKVLEYIFISGDIYGLFAIFVWTEVLIYLKLFTY